jgi:hypothetical protein
MNQVLEQKYIDKQKLVSLLSRLFPLGTWSIEVSIARPQRQNVH